MERRTTPTPEGVSTLAKFIASLFAAAIFVAILTAFGAWYTVGQDERGVLTRWGAIVAENVPPGLHWKTPWVEGYDTIKVSTLKTIYGDTPETRMEAYSRDQQPAHFKISVNWHADPAKVGEIYWRYGGTNGLVDRLLDRHVPQQSKNVFGQYDAITLIRDRAKFNRDVFDALQQSVQGEPIIIESVQVEDVTFSEDYINAVKQRMIAEVQVQQLRQNEEQQKVNAEITVINAEAAAKATVAKATAEATAVELNGKAVAAAIKAQAEALATNPSLVMLEQAKRWDGKLPTQMIPGAAIPFLNVTPNGLPQTATQ